MQIYDTVRAALTRREMIPKVSVDSSSVKEIKKKSYACSCTGTIRAETP